jgi:glutamyl/glutaminyl-tRNA synthetase
MNKENFDPYYAIGFTQGILDRFKKHLTSLNIEQVSLLDEAMTYQQQLLEYTHEQEKINDFIKEVIKPSIEEVENSMNEMFDTKNMETEGGKYIDNLEYIKL